MNIVPMYFVYYGIVNYMILLIYGGYMKVGLVLEGGGMRGLYTAGILDAMLEESINIDGIIGVSAGAVFGVNYPSKQKGRVLRYNKKYLKDSRYMSFLSLITTGNIVNKQFAYYDIPFKLDVFDEEAFSKSNIDFYVTLTNVETGQAEYKKIINASIQIEEFRASSAMPFVSKIVKIDNKKYLDGGIADSIPIDKMKKLGYDKIIVVLTRPKDYRKEKSNTFINNLFYWRYPNFVKSLETRYQRYNDTLDKITNLEKKKEIFVIRPSEKIKIKRMEKDINKLQEMYDLGIKDFKSSLKKLKQYLKY